MLTCDGRELACRGNVQRWCVEALAQGLHAASVPDQAAGWQAEERVRRGLGAEEGSGGGSPGHGGVHLRARDAPTHESGVWRRPETMDGEVR